jgi:FHA domain
MIWIVIAVLVVAACVAVPLYLDWRHTRQSTFPREVAPLVFQMPGPEGQAEVQRLRESVAAPERPAPESVVERFAPPPKPLEITAAPHSVSPNDTIHFRRPSEEVLQLLPGRLEVLSGIPAPREIRFVRIPGEQPQLILGREPGPSPPHVALPSGTVSRQHARLEFSGGRWGLTNLSRTNPVVVNDETLSNVQGQRPLVDGDRIELGDVVLRFSAH